MHVRTQFVFTGFRAFCWMIDYLFFHLIPSISSAIDAARCAGSPATFPADCTLAWFKTCCVAHSAPPSRRKDRSRLRLDRSASHFCEQHYGIVRLFPCNTEKQQTSTRRLSWASQHTCTRAGNRGQECIRRQSCTQTRIQAVQNLLNLLA